MDLTFIQLVTIILGFVLFLILIYGFYIVLSSKDENYKGSNIANSDSAQVKRIEKSSLISTNTINKTKASKRNIKIMKA